jgi:hypothetical protein
MISRVQVGGVYRRKIDVEENMSQRLNASEVDEKQKSKELEAVLSPLNG